jgi:hypothetical protein
MGNGRGVAHGVKARAAAAPAILTKNGYQVMVAPNRPDGLEVARDCASHVEIPLTDAKGSDLAPLPVESRADLRV